MNYLTNLFFRSTSPVAAKLPLVVCLAALGFALYAIWPYADHITPSRILTAPKAPGALWILLLGIIWIKFSPYVLWTGKSKYHRNSFAAASVPVPGWNLADVFLAAFTIIVAISVVLNLPDPYLFLDLVLYPAAPFFGAYLLARRISQNQSQILVLSLLAICLPLVLLAGAEAAGFAFFSYEGPRPGATLGTRSAVAHLVAAMLPLALWLFYAAWRRSDGLRVPQKIALLALPYLYLMACLGVLILTRSRAAWACVLFSGFIFIVIKFIARMKADSGITHEGQLPPASRYFALLLLSVVLAAGALVNQCDSGLNWRDTGNPYINSMARMGEFKTGTGAERMVQHQVGLSALKAKPFFGIGPSNWRRDTPLYAEGFKDDPFWASSQNYLYPDSDWLRITTESGLLALLMLGLFFTSLATRTLTLKTEPNGPGMDLSSKRAMAFAMLILVGCGFLDASLMRVQTALLLGILAGHLSRTPVRKLKVRSAAGNQSRARRLAFLATLLLSTSATGMLLAVTLGVTARTAAVIYVADSNMELFVLRNAARIHALPHLNYLYLRREWPDEWRCREFRAELLANIKVYPNDWYLRHLRLRCASFIDVSDADYLDDLAIVFRLAPTVVASIHKEGNIEWISRPPKPQMSFEDSLDRRTINALPRHLNPTSACTNADEMKPPR